MSLLYRAHNRLAFLLDGPIDDFEAMSRSNGGFLKRWGHPPGSLLHEQGRDECLVSSKPACGRLQQGGLGAVFHGLAARRAVSHLSSRTMWK
jgi:hypothetical protein